MNFEKREIFKPQTFHPSKKQVWQLSFYSYLFIFYFACLSLPFARSPVSSPSFQANLRPEIQI